MKADNEVSDYFNKLPADERKVLASIRKQILKLIPDSEERLSRGVPFFYYKGKRAVGLRSSKKHLSFFIMEGDVLNDFRMELSDYKNGSTVINFSTENPLSADLIEKLVLARIIEIEKKIQQK